MTDPCLLTSLMPVAAPACQQCPPQLSDGSVFPKDFPCVCAQLLQSCLTLCDPMDSSPPGSSIHGDSPGKNTGVGCHALLQGIVPIQGLNLHLLSLLYYQVGSLPLAPLEKPMMFLSAWSWCLGKEGVLSASWIVKLDPHLTFLHRQSSQVWP